MEKLLTLLQLSHREYDFLLVIAKMMMGFLIITLVIIFTVEAKGAEYDNEYQGIYYWGAEVNTFSPCDLEKTFWVSGSSWVLRPLYDYVKEETKSSYQPVYIEFRGHLLDEKLDGFASDYDGLIRISELRLKSVNVPQQCRVHPRKGQ